MEEAMGDIMGVGKTFALQGEAFMDKAWNSIILEEGYEVLTLDPETGVYTPQSGVPRGPYTLFGLRVALRQLMTMGYSARRSDQYVLVRRVPEKWEDKFAMVTIDLDRMSCKQDLLDAAKAFDRLAAYARVKARAMRLRDGGRSASAMVEDRQADKIYEELPQWAKR
jgi:hypothetical protein